MHLQNTIATLVTLLAVGNLFTGLPLFTEGIPFLNNLAEEFIPFYGSSRGEWAIWAHHDLGIFVLTIFTLISCFILLEKDLVINLHIARFLFRKYEEFHRFNGTLIRKQIKIESRKYIFSAIASIIFPTAALAAMLFALFLNIKLYISQF